MQHHHMRYWDRLYGRLEFEPYEWEIFQTPEFARINRVSLSAHPHWSLTTCTPAFRGEHGRGVSFLAKVVARKKRFEEERVNLICAALLHDIGAPPFSHSSEDYQEAIFGIRHEEFARCVIFNSKIAEIISNYKGNPEKVVAYIAGERTYSFSSLINGGKNGIDLDNLDNTLRYGSSKGLINVNAYNPFTIADSFVITDENEIAMDVRCEREIKRWEQCRMKVYEYMYDTENLCVAAMLERALTSAFLCNELTKEFFSMGDDEATWYLLKKSNIKTRNIMRSMINWDFFPLAATRTFDYGNGSRTLREVCHEWKGRDQLSNYIARSLKIPLENVCVFVGVNKGFKQIEVPFMFSDGEKKLHQSLFSRQTAEMKIYIANHDKKWKHTINKIVDDFFIEENEIK